MLVIFHILAAALLAGAERLHTRGVEAGMGSAAVCRSAGTGGGHDSGESDGAGRCAACILGCDGSPAHLAAAAASIALPPPPPDTTRAPAIREIFVSVAGWRSSWSSRAPPIG